MMKGFGRKKNKQMKPNMLQQTQSCLLKTGSNHMGKTTKTANANLKWNWMIEGERPGRGEGRRSEQRRRKRSLFSHLVMQHKTLNRLLTRNHKTMKWLRVSRLSIPVSVRSVIQQTSSRFKGLWSCLHIGSCRRKKPTVAHSTIHLFSSLAEAQLARLFVLYLRYRSVCSICQWVSRCNGPAESGGGERGVCRRERWRLTLNLTWQWRWLENIYKQRG